jgi:AcrR family transcriptional regulator
MTTKGSLRNGKGRRQQIMQAAARLFSRQGFRGTTTRQIAERARVNEALIFRHFRTKEDLYWTVIEQQCLETRKDARTISGPSSGENVRRVFASIAEDVLGRQNKHGTLTRLLLFSALESQRLSNRFLRTYLAEYYEPLSNYIREHIREGIIRPVDPDLAVRSFIGMVISHSFAEELFGRKKFRQPGTKQLSTTLANIWLNGIFIANGQPLRAGDESVAEADPLSSQERPIILSHAVKAAS